MKTLIIGANGQIGRLIAAKGKERGLELRCMIRDEDQRGFFEELGLPTVIADLEEEGSLVRAFEGVRQVVFTAGSGAHTGHDKTLMVDLHGAVRAIDLSLEEGVKHFVMVSAYRVDEVLTGPEKLRPYFAAKDAADRWLRASGVHHTILRPGRLTDEPGTGRIRTEKGASDVITIPREDVAAVVVEVLANQVPESRTVDLMSGDTPIVEALRGFVPRA